MTPAGLGDREAELASQPRHVLGLDRARLLGVGAQRFDCLDPAGAVLDADRADRFNQLSEARQDGTVRS